MKKKSYIRGFQSCCVCMCVCEEEWLKAPSHALYASQHDNEHNSRPLPSPVPPCSSDIFIPSFDFSGQMEEH